MTRLKSFGRVQGWAIGAFGEASPDLHRLLNLFARKGGANLYTYLGVDSPLKARPHIKARCCSEMGIAAVRSGALHKIQALTQVLVGKGAAAAQTRRRQTAAGIHKARCESYFAQHSFYADDLPRRPWSADL